MTYIELFLYPLQYVFETSKDTTPDSPFVVTSKTTIVYSISGASNSSNFSSALGSRKIGHSRDRPRSRKSAASPTRDVMYDVYRNVSSEGLMWVRSYCLDSFRGVGARRVAVFPAAPQMPGAPDTTQKVSLPSFPTYGIRLNTLDRVIVTEKVILGLSARQSNVSRR